METQIIGKRIAEARKRINISQAQLAQQLFISPQAVGKWERGESIPDIVTCSRLAEILGVDLNYFATGLKSHAQQDLNDESRSIESGTGSIAKTRNVRNWNMSRGNWSGADFSGIKNLHEKFSASNMQNCKFVGSELSGILLKGNNVSKCDFSGSDISNSNIQSSNLANNSFINCSLIDTEFLASHVSGCDFSGSDFTGVLVKSGGFDKNTMTGALLNRTSFIDSYLANLMFDGRIEDCSFENCSFSRVTFENATLINTFFKCRSLKRIKFINCQADRMTYEFLKNGRADLNGLTLLTE